MSSVSVCYGCSKAVEKDARVHRTSGAVCRQNVVLKGVVAKSGLENLENMFSVCLKQQSWRLDCFSGSSLGGGTGCLGFCG